MKRAEGDVQVDEQGGDEPREKAGKCSPIFGFLLALVVLPLPRWGWPVFQSSRDPMQKGNAHYEADQFEEAISNKERC